MTRTQRILFGKAIIEQLPTPEKGQRDIYADTRTAYLFLRVTPTGRTFYFQRTIRSKKKVITIGKFDAINVATARQRVGEINVEYALGSDVQADIRSSKSELTLEALWDDYRMNRSGGKVGKVSKSNDYNYIRHFKQWENLKLSEITYDMARKMILAIRKRAPVHGNRVHALGKSMWTYAIRELRWGGESPWTFKRLSEKGSDRSAFRLKKSDMRNFKEALDSLEPLPRVLFWSSLLTGRRIGECMRMQWAQIDLSGGNWTISDVKDRGKTQICVLPTPLIMMLVELQKTKRSKWVFPKDSKSGHIENINNDWNKVRAFGFRHLQARDLRGTMISWMQEAGVPLVGASQQAGHADSAVTAKHYSNIALELQREGVEDAATALVEAAD